MPSFAHFGARKKKAKASSSAAAWLEPEGFSELSQVTVPEGDTEGKAEDYVGRFDFSLESPHRPEDVSKYRRAVVGGLALATIFSPHLNRALAKVWSTVRVTPWFRNDMFEPLVAVGSFFLWIHVWFGVDWLATSGRAPRLRNYQIVPKRLLKDEAGAPRMDQPERQLLSKWYSGWVFEMAVYLLPLWAIASWTDWFAPRRAALTMAAPTVARVAQEIIGGLFLYDFFFWFGHVAFHKVVPRRFYGRVHGKHHSAPDVRASDTVRLTVLEETVDVMCSIAALRLLKAHPLSRCLYNVVITFLLVELHCGYDMPWSPQNVVPGNVVAGSRRHHMHHAKSNVYFQKFFTWMDGLCGFVLPARRTKKGMLAV